MKQKLKNLYYKLQDWNKSKKNRLVHIGLVLVLLSVIIYLVLPTNRYQRYSFDEMVWGITYSADYAESLGLDSQGTYEKMLQEFNISSVRIPVYWDEVEPMKGQYNFDELDWQMQTALNHDISVVLAIGYKVPRWPECRKPNWASFNPNELQRQLEDFISFVVTRYKNAENLYAWQIENEPYFEFGECMARVDNFMQREIEIVSNIDPKNKLIVTDSGELGSWRKASKVGADIFGFTTYRKVHNPIFGYFKWFLTPNSYRKKTYFIDENIKDVYAMELQLEPWHKNFIGNVRLEEQKEIFTLNEMKSNLDFAVNMGVSHTYLWGVEWWYYLAEKHDYNAPKNLVIEYLK